MRQISSFRYNSINVFLMLQYSYYRSLAIVVVRNRHRVFIRIVRVYVLVQSSLQTQLNPQATSLTLYQLIVPSLFSLIIQTYLQDTRFTLFRGRTSSYILFSSKLSISSTSIDLQILAYSLFITSFQLPGILIPLISFTRKAYSSILLQVLSRSLSLLRTCTIITRAILVSLLFTSMSSSQ